MKESRQPLRFGFFFLAYLEARARNARSAAHEHFNRKLAKGQRSALTDLVYEKQPEHQQNPGVHLTKAGEKSSEHSPSLLWHHLCLVWAGLRERRSPGRSPLSLCSGSSLPGSRHESSGVASDRRRN
eukprot:scaffold7029_cov375-Pinguiococcus_pyrenoidosus.AAC.27